MDPDYPVTAARLGSLLGDAPSAFGRSCRKEIPFQEEKRIRLQFKKRIRLVKLGGRQLRFLHPDRTRSTSSSRHELMAGPTARCATRHPGRERRKASRPSTA